MSKRCSIIWMESVNSTNDWVKLNINQLDDLTVVAAGHQSAGRGQGVHTWLSEDGKNILSSLLLKGRKFPARDQFAISAITALSIIDLLAEYDIQARIKWPNDIYVDGKKICGLLIEHTVRGLFLSTTIIGIGLNVNQTYFHPSLPNPTSMAILNNMEYDIKNILSRLTEIFISRLDEYTKNGDLNSLRIEFNTLSLS